ncbi:lantibiotic dehydratase [Nocardioides sp. NPDC057772]|uniref:lantibiotic dehydratase n=1 Tax=Nocardioides sp. NPDC057772 TaxID=3346245 RepID=UPI0036705753
MYRALERGIIRSARTEITASAPGYPGPQASVEVTRRWLASVWEVGQFVEALATASASLEHAAVEVIDGSVVDARTVRRTALSVWRYLQRSRYRSTPFGLFAGIGQLSFGATTLVTQRAESILTRPDALWVDEVVTRLEADPAMLLRAVVVTDETCLRHRTELVLPHRPGGDRPSEVRLRLTEPVRDIVDLARSPIGVSDLVAKLDGAYPGATTQRLLQTIASLTSAGVLHSDLRPSSDAPDPMAHITRHLPKESLSASPPALAVDLASGVEATLPTTVAEALERSLAVMAGMSPYPSGAPAWRDYHARFLEAYSLGALVPVLDLVDQRTGLGYPAGFRGSVTASPAPLNSSRDEHLLALVQAATRSGEIEVAITERDIDALSVGRAERVPASVELTASIEASSAADIDRGDFRLVCAGLSAAAGTTTGRFLPILPESARRTLGQTFADIPALAQHAVRVQITAPPLRIRTGNVTRSGTIGLEVLPVGEHHQAATMAVSDLAVGATPGRLYLLHLPTGRQIEPFVMNAVELTSATHPLVRFLSELPRSHTSVMTPFYWGAAQRLPFLPRVRHGRVVLSEARWLLKATDLSVMGADALGEWRERWNVPATVYLGSDDQRLRIDLTDSAQRDCLLAELTQHDRVTLTEAPSEDAYGWIGRAHQITLAFAADQDQAPEPPIYAAQVGTTPRHERVPGRDQTVLLKLYAPAEAHNEILTSGLTDLLNAHADVLTWWFTRYQDPEPHLRIRLRLRTPDALGTVASEVGAHVANGRARSCVSWASDLPEYGRYGTGGVLDAAEDVFAADSRAALAQAAIADPCEREAVTAASLVDLSVALLGSRIDALRWLTNYLPRNPSAQERSIQDRAIQFSAPTLPDDVQCASLTELWKARSAAIATYAGLLNETGAEPANIVASLLHMHLNRVHGIAPEDEPSRLRTARTAALSWLKRQEPPA